MAEMIFYTYSEKTKGLFNDKGTPKQQKIGKTLKSNVLAKMLSLNTLCDDYLEGFEEGSTDNWLGLMKKPVEIEEKYLVRSNEKWIKAYEKDQERIEKRYQKIVEKIKAKNLPPLREREEIEKEVAKDREMQRHVDNPLQKTEIPLHYNRYMEGQNISFQSTEATKDLQNLIDAVKSLKAQRIACSEMFDMVETSVGFGGFFSPSVSAVIDRIEAQANVCLSGWETVLLTLTTGSGLTRQQAQRLVSKWVRTLRKLRRDAGGLLNTIRVAAPYLSYGSQKMKEHILGVSRTGSQSITHREIFYWCTKNYSEGNSGTLAKSYAANGFEDNMWARDLYYKTPKNYYDYPKENGNGYESPYIVGDKFYVVKFLEDHGMGYPWTDSIDVRDLVLSSLDNPPNSKLSTIITDFLNKPGGKKHTLEGEDPKIKDV